MCADFWTCMYLWKHVQYISDEDKDAVWGLLKVKQQDCANNVKWCVHTHREISLKNICGATECGNEPALKACYVLTPVWMWSSVDGFMGGVHRVHTCRIGPTGHIICVCIYSIIFGVFMWCECMSELWVYFCFSPSVCWVRVQYIFLLYNIWVVVHNVRCEGAICPCLEMCIHSTLTSTIY